MPVACVSFSASGPHTPGSWQLLSDTVGPVDGAECAVVDLDAVLRGGDRSAPGDPVAVWTFSELPVWATTIPAFW